ncbi:helix-turn-helix domain-containing protein [Nocardioides sp. NPDC051685]|uniref:AraC family transcriptional regulator n=1 Tax=Nocardioides sp. NPDC051685 TaxID=3364334 RepID=UPI0037BD83AB
MPATYKNVRFPNMSVRLMHDLLVENGIDPQPAIREAQIEPSALSTAGGLLTGGQELAFQSAFARLTANRRGHWAELGFRYRLPTLRSNGFAMMTAPTIRDWTRAVAENVDLYYSFCEMTAIESDGVVAGLQLDYAQTPRDLVEFSVHRDLAATIGAQEELWEGPFPYTQITVPLSDLDAQLSAKIRAPIQYGAEALQLKWSTTMSTRPLPHGDELQFQTYLEEARRLSRQFRLDVDWKASVTAAMTRTSPMATGLTELAALLNMSKRTLQRRLLSANMSFRELRDQARFAVAREALASSNVSITDLARRLGYAEPTAFATAFKRWAGTSPTAFRADPSRYQCRG